MKKVRHPYIVELIEDIHLQKCIFLLLELVRGGDLYAFITESGYYLYLSYSNIMSVFQRIIVQNKRVSLATT